MRTLITKFLRKFQAVGELIIHAIATAVATGCIACLFSGFGIVVYMLSVLVLVVCIYTVILVDVVREDLMRNREYPGADD